MRTQAPPGSIAGLPTGLPTVPATGPATGGPVMTVMTGGRPAWTPVSVGTGAVGVAERDALGTNVRVAVCPAHHLAAALGAVDTELDRLDRVASRFRPDSEISCIQGGGHHLISPGLAEAITVALTAARWTGGLVDPTVGAALIGLGYDRDFAAIGADSGTSGPARPVPGWQSVRLDGNWLTMPAGVHLDLGATAKGLGSDRAAAAAWRAAGGGGVLVSLGGDIAVAGDPPAGGWPVMVADSSTPGDGDRPGVCQLVRLAAGAVATSSVTSRRWQRGGQLLHHIVDPRTGRPAGGPWRTVSVAADTCAAANAAATAAIVAGDRAEGWLSTLSLAARLVSHGGTVRRTGGWPAAEGGALPVDGQPGTATGTYRPGCARTPLRPSGCAPSSRCG